MNGVNLMTRLTQRPDIPVDAGQFMLIEYRALTRDAPSLVPSLPPARKRKAKRRRPKSAAFHILWSIGESNS